MSRSIVFYLHVHQPWRIQPFSVFDIGTRHNYFQASNDQQTDNRVIFEKVARTSYWPMTEMLLSLLEKHPEFSCNLSITGSFLEQCQQFAPTLLQNFQKLVATGRVEIIAETYHHSLAFFYSRFEFEKQVLMHREKIQQLFGVTPRVFRNTELSYNNRLAQWAQSAGYVGVLAEGWDPILRDRTPNQVFLAERTKNLKLLLKNYRLSDDIAFRFSDKNWQEWPLVAEKYETWLMETEPEAVINLFMDFETFGEHQWAETGIFDFWQHLTEKWIGAGQKFQTATAACVSANPTETISMPDTVTWADTERDLSAWIGNKMQTEALTHLYDMETGVLRTRDDELIEDWRNLQTSDHVYYMSTKWFNDGDVHAYFSPYDSPYDAFLYFLNALRDIRWRVSEHHKGAI